ncbi:MAG: type I-E CRISPR-associated protein Cas5/CasD [Chloroflexota bacterium]
MTTLLLRLAGPMQSWGTQSRFSERDCGHEPSKSGVIGLICAALGKPRREDPSDRSHPKLADLAALDMGVRVDREGVVQRDFQTAGGGTLTGDRYGVARARGVVGDTVTSSRYFIADAQYLVGLEGDDALLRRIDRALRHPVWPLGLGRRSYLPDPPVWLPDGLSRKPLRLALREYPWLARTAAEAAQMRAASAERPLTLRLVLESADDASADIRCDVPLCFAERRFAPRFVTTETMTLTSDLIREDTYVSHTPGH